MSADPARGLGPCGCCEVLQPPTPEEIWNRPGLSAIGYRVGTYGSFRQAMTEAIARSPGLRGWTARTHDDYGIALMEMWAYLGDVLTFYQERIANEAFLRTALLPESVRRLGNQLDYRPSPGGAATAFLAFTLEENASLEVPEGLRVQSVPGEDEMPQKFETTEKLLAEARLNRLSVYPTPERLTARPYLLPEGRTWAYTKNHIDGLAPGDDLVIYSEYTPSQREDKTVKDLQTVDGRQRLDWKPPIRRPFRHGAKVRKWVRKYRLFGYDAPRTPPNKVRASKISPSDEDIELDLDAVYDNLKENSDLLLASPIAGQSSTSHTYAGAMPTAFLPSGIFGQIDAFKRRLPSPEVGVRRVTVTGIRLVDATMRSTKGTPLVQTAVTRLTVEAVEQKALWPWDSLDPRDTVIYELDGPEVALWDQEYKSEEITGREVFVPLAELGIPASEAEELLSTPRSLLLADDHGAVLVTTVPDGCTADDEHLKILFTPEVPRPLKAEHAALFGNVARATHGETVAEEILGSGDASTSFQSFSLAKSPVTYVPTPGKPHGLGSTLDVRVDGVRWREVDRFYGQASDDRVYATNVDDEGATTVQFGDGVTGRRLTSGRNNVVATYRQGSGVDGNVKANSLTTLLDRPLGLKASNNPTEAQGGANPESRDEVRTNAPNTVRTFGRIVSLRDFEDAAREFVGVAKARASWRWEDEEQVVALTVAGDEGTKIGDLSALIADLNSRRDPYQRMRVEEFTQVHLRIAARIRVDPDHVEEAVARAARESLLAYFAFANLDLGQPIHLSDVYRVLQDVSGVEAVRIETLQFRDEVDRASRGLSEEDLRSHLSIRPDELATLEDSAEDVLVTPGL